MLQSELREEARRELSAAQAGWVPWWAPLHGCPVLSDQRVPLAREAFVSDLLRLSLEKQSPVKMT